MQSQTVITVKVNEQYDYCVSRLIPQQVVTEVTCSSGAPPTMSTNQLEISHELIMASVVESTDKAATTEIGEDTTLYRKKVQQVMGVKIITAATRIDKNIQPICMFLPTQKRDWKALQLAYGDYWYHVRNRLQVKNDCLLLKEMIINLQQLRQIILDSLHSTQPRASAMLDLSENI